MCKQQLASLVVMQDGCRRRAGPKRIQLAAEVSSVDQHVTEAKGIKKYGAHAAKAAGACETLIFDQESWQVVLHKVRHIVSSITKPPQKKMEDLHKKHLCHQN